MKAKLRIVLSDNCTQNCIFCSHDFNRAKNLEMPKEQAIRCIDAFSLTEGDTVSFSGGEPTSHQDFSELLDYVKGKELIAQLTTNGTLLHTLSDEQLKKIDILHISLNSLNPDSYNSIARPVSSDSFSQILKSLERLDKLNITYTINTVYLEQYKKEIPQIISLSKEKGFLVQVMNDMLADSNYFKKYSQFTETINNADGKIRIRTTTHPNFPACKGCSNRDNCASTRAIWCFPNKTISACPYRKELTEELTNFNDNVQRIYNFIISN